MPQKSTEPGSFNSGFIEKQQHWGPCRQGHTPTWAPSLSSWELGSSPGPRGYFGTSWGLRTPPPHHGLTVQIQEQTTTVRPTTVPYPLHPGQTQSVSCPRGLQLLYPPLSCGGEDRGEDQQRFSWPGGVVLHSHGAGQGRVGMGIVRDNHKTLLLTTKCLPDQKPSPQVPSHCYSCAHTNIHMHTFIHGWRCPRILTPAHTHATHECDFLGTYSHMST